MATTYRRLVLPALSGFLVFAIAGMFIFSHATSAHASDNLVTNPGFESGDLSNWSCDAGDTTVVSPVNSGSYALEMKPTASTTGQCTQTISVQANTTYTLSAYLNGPYAYIGVSGDAATWANSTNYASLAMNFTTSSAQTHVTIYIHAWYAQSSVYVDDVSLIGPGGSSTPTPTNTPIPTPTNTPTPISMPTPTPTNTPIPTPTNTPTSTPVAGLLPVAVTFYSDEGLMADGQETHLGACAALTTQFPFGTKIQLFDPQDLTTAAYSCTIEDTGVHICQNNIDVALPGQTQEAIQLGVQNLLLKNVGFDQTVADEAAQNHPSSPGCSGGPTH